MPIALRNALFAATVIVFACGGGVLSRLTLTRPMQHLGMLSYSFYMVHALVFLVAYVLLGKLGWAAKVVGQQGEHWSPLLPSHVADLLGCAMMLVALLCSHVLWRWVEWPCREWSRRMARQVGAARAEAAAPTF